jgi:hypothetical protein
MFGVAKTVLHAREIVFRRSFFLLKIGCARCPRDAIQLCDSSISHGVDLLIKLICSGLCNQGSVV